MRPTEDRGERGGWFRTRATPRLAVGLCVVIAIAGCPRNISRDKPIEVAGTGMDCSKTDIAKERWYVGILEKTQWETTGVKASITTYDPKLCSKGLMKTGANAHINIELQPRGEVTQFVQVGYCKINPNTANRLKYYYEFVFTKDDGTDDVGGCFFDDFQFGDVTPGHDPDFEIVQVNQGTPQNPDWRWQVRAAGGSATGEPNCLGCRVGGGSATWVSETAHPETQCMGDTNNKVTFAGCQTQKNRGAYDRPAWQELLPGTPTSPNYVRSNPSVGDTSVSFTIHDDRTFP